MGHEWGSNVQAFGLGSAGITMCARLLGSLNEIYITNMLAGVDRVVVWVVGLNSGGDEYMHAETSFRWTPHFPYTYPVPPDAPV